MFQFFLDTDETLLKAVNGFHHPIADALMWQISHLWIWIPLLVWVLYLIIQKYRIQTLRILLWVALLIFLTDQTTNLFKRNVARPRPSREPDLSGQLHHVNAYRGGAYGFFSGHASNTMGVAMFLALLLGSGHRSMKYILFSWAGVVGYSRIYLGVHYPGDVLAGFLFGMLAGWMIYRLYLFSESHWKPYEKVS